MILHTQYSQFVKPVVIEFSTELRISSEYLPLITNSLVRIANLIYKHATNSGALSVRDGPGIIGLRACNTTPDPESLDLTELRLTPRQDCDDLTVPVPVSSGYAI